MAEFFLELFSEEIPAKLQRNLREKMLEEFQNFFSSKSINSIKNFSLSTPNRMIIVFEGLDKQIKISSEEIRGPKTNAPEQALEGFLRSNRIEEKDLFKRNTEKGEFYFFKSKAKTLNTQDLLTEFIPKLLENYQWKKSMRWGEFDLIWGRPLKSILSVFDNKTINFEFHHIVSSNSTFIDKDFEDKKKVFNNFKSYEKFFKRNQVIINQNIRKKIISKEFLKILKKRRLKIEENESLLNEVVDLVENPNVLSCSFDKKFLSIPKEILILTMQSHQKYFPTFDEKNQVTNEFLIVANKKDKKGLIKIGNERVIEARLSDAEFFWKKNKSQNLVKQISKLKNINYFKGLGSYYDKVQRIRKLSSLISDELLISKEKIEIASSICKVDLLSDLVGEFPELQGILGGYFAEAQGFEKEVCIAVSEHYLPTGLESKIPKKPYSIALSLSDKLDSLVGFFGLGLKPTSSKDPYALRRSAIGLLKMILENNKELKLKDLINYSCQLYFEQDISFNSKIIQKDLSEFFHDRFKNLMKEKNIRNDIIESVTLNHSIDNILKIYNKTIIFNRLISKEIGKDIMFSYKRASNIISNELRTGEIKLIGSADPGLFRNEFEKILYKKIHEIRKDFTIIDKDKNYEQILKILSLAKKEVNDFFDNVIVNDEDELIKKNRLELLQMLCKTFDNYLNFSKVESL